jgi:hypothetical protein
MYTQPLDFGLDFWRGYIAGQFLTKVYPAANDNFVRSIGWRRCFEASQRARVDCSEFVSGMLTGFKDELAGLAHPLPVGGE